MRLHPWMSSRSRNRRPLREDRSRSRCHHPFAPKGRDPGGGAMEPPGERTRRSAQCSTAVAPGPTEACCEHLRLVVMQTS
jgi:hypothetical protein